MFLRKESPSARFSGEGPYSLGVMCQAAPHERLGMHRAPAKAGQENPRVLDCCQPPGLSLTLGVLLGLAGSPEARLLALLDPWVAGQEAALA